MSIPDEVAAEIMGRPWKKAKIKRTKPNKPKPEYCEAPDCKKKPTCVLGGFWFCTKHGNRDYESP